MPWAAAGAVAGGLIAAKGARDAADTGAGGARDASRAQERMFNRQVELQAPFRDAGLSANNRLQYLLGLSPSGGGAGAPASLSYEDLRKELESQFTTSKQGKGKLEAFVDPADGQTYYRRGNKNVVDQAGLDAAIRKRLDEQKAASFAAAQGDQDYGSLMRRFSMEDFEADPGYAFRQQEGMKGIEGGAAARGGLLSGGALKAIQKYGQDLASQEYGNAYGRFNADQTNQYNRLAGIVNTGQGATNQITNAAGNLGSQIGSNIISAANAQAAGQIGQANAWNSMIGSGMNAYQNNQLMNLIQRPGSSGTSNQPTVESYYGY